MAIKNCHLKIDNFQIFKNHFYDNQINLYIKKNLKPNQIFLNDFFF